MSVLLYGCTTWTLTKRIKKKQFGNCTRMLLAILNKSWKQHPTKQQLYGHLLPISKTIQIRRTRHAGHYLRSKDELISDVLRWALHSHLPPISKTIQDMQDCWRSKDEHISDVLLWTPSHACAVIERPARTYLQQLCTDTGCCLEHLPEAIDNRNK